MRTIYKKLKCINRSDSAQNKTAIAKVIDRYVKKMAAKGWTLDESYYSDGNEYFTYIAYIRLYK